MPANAAQRTPQRTVLELRLYSPAPKIWRVVGAPDYMFMRHRDIRRGHKYERFTVQNWSTPDDANAGAGSLEAAVKRWLKTPVGAAALAAQKGT